MPTPHTLNLKGKLMTLHQPHVMGILNITADSFYAESRYTSVDAALRKAEQMLTDGADIIDIGGQSTRPGASSVAADEELKRVMPVLEAIIKHLPQTIMSIDTYYGRVATEGVGAGAALINDISAGSMDSDMLPAVAQLKVPYILMHIKGTPATMQQHPDYNNVMAEVIKYFSEKLNKLRLLGIADVIIDPGFGFGKTLEHNYTLLCHLKEFEMFGCPLLAGLSRKGMIQAATGTDAAGALNGTTAAHMAALMNGADLLRVHDVKEAVEVVKVYCAMQGKPL
ncbi:MAG: dihydropteroate synthase [Flavobacteriales bacterium]